MNKLPNHVFKFYRVQLQPFCTLSNFTGECCDFRPLLFDCPALNKLNLKIIFVPLYLHRYALSSVNATLIKYVLNIVLILFILNVVTIHYMTDT